MADTFGKAIVALSNSAPYVNQSVPLATIIVYGMIETSPVVPSRKNFFTIGSGDRKT